MNASNSQKEPALSGGPLRTDLPPPSREDIGSNRDLQEFEEKEQLSKFLDAYENVVSERLLNIDRDSKGERPDFICQSSDGTRIGIELTEIPHRALPMWDKVFNPDMRWLELLDDARKAVFQKDAKMSNGGWRQADKQILVIMLNSHGFDSLEWLSDHENQQGFVETGFAEIWLCDNTTLQAHGSSQLIGLFPQEVWGLHRPQHFDPKPFG